MSKPKKTREKTDTKGKTATTSKNTLMIAAGAIIILAIIGVAAYILLMPGTSPAAVTGDPVSVIYTGMFTNGTVFDSNVNGTPINFTIGSHQVIPGFENAIVGMAAGQTKTVNIPVDQAYGPYKPEYIHVINRTGTLATMELIEGGMLTYRDPSTNSMSAVKILNFTKNTVTIDGNSPLAGEPLTFTIQLVSINKNTA
ncbi:MAG: FKBP-type peptidyl-prolyl cis-trans isomerase [Methanoregula sp.]|nr:FKBP-type peptidyl-prolyl cis-trans isomerase [Methanoregula sp.]